MATLDRVTVAGTWTLVHSGAFTGTVFCLTADAMVYRIASSLPSEADPGFIGNGHVAVSIGAGSNLYARAIDGAAIVVLDSGTGLGGFPSGVFEGFRAITTQSYDEANKKNGTQWEASRLLTLAGEAIVYSIILTGSKPVDLKSRVLGYTGLGVVGRIFKAPTYTGGTTDPWYNLNTEVSGQPLAQLISAPTVSNNGTQIGADIHGIGPASQIAKGSTPYHLGANRILTPNTAFLLEIQSLDTAPQEVTARLEMYEGDMDLPLQ